MCIVVDFFSSRVRNWTGFRLCVSGAVRLSGSFQFARNRMDNRHKEKTATFVLGVHHSTQFCENSLNFNINWDNLTQFKHNYFAIIVLLYLL